MKRSTVVDLNLNNKTKTLGDFMADKIGNMKLTSDEMAGIAETEMLFPDLIASGHMIALPARAGVGKTQLMMAISPHLIKRGKEIVYINVDIPAGDLPRHMEHAEKHGINLITPDIKVGTSVDTAIEFMESAAAHTEMLTDYIFIIDTLKKFTDMISKAKLKERLNLFRRLTSRGATVIMLCHCNKADDVNGNPVFEGCEDLRSDSDELIYLFSQKDEDAGTNLISTESQQSNGAKNRLPNINNISILLKDFEIIGKPDFADIKQKQQFQARLNKDSEIIIAIRRYLQFNNHSVQINIVNGVNEAEGIGKTAIKTALKYWAGKDLIRHRWYVKTPKNENKIIYSLHPDNVDGE